MPRSRCFAVWFVLVARSRNELLCDCLLRVANTPAANGQYRYERAIVNNSVIRYKPDKARHVDYAKRLVIVENILDIAPIPQSFFLFPRFLFGGVGGCGFGKSDKCAVVLNTFTLPLNSVPIYTCPSAEVSVALAAEKYVLSLKCLRNTASVSSLISNVSGSAPALRITLRSSIMLSITFAFVQRSVFAEAGAPTSVGSGDPPPLIRYER